MMGRIRAILIVLILLQPHGVAAQEKSQVPSSKRPVPGITGPMLTLTEEEVQSAVKSIQERRPLQPELEKKVFTVSSQAELEKIKMLFEYTKFHLGLYLTLLAAIVAFITSSLGPPIGSKTSFLFLGTIVMLALAGAAGGIVGANLPNYVNHTEFEKQEFGKFILSMTASDWITWEHRLFWVGIALMVLGFLTFAFTRIWESRVKSVSKVLSAYVESWNNKDIEAVTRLWTEDAEWRTKDRVIGPGRAEIKRHLQELFSPDNRPLGFTDTEVRTKAGNAVIDGNMEYMTSEGKVSKPFTAVLKKNGSWMIQVWVETLSKKLI